MSANNLRVLIIVAGEDKYLSFPKGACVPPAVVEHFPQHLRRYADENGVLSMNVWVPLQYAKDTWPWLRPPYLKADTQFEVGFDLTDHLGVGEALLVQPREVPVPLVVEDPKAPGFMAKIKRALGGGKK